MTEPLRWRGRYWLPVIAVLFAAGLAGNLQDGGPNVVVNAIIQCAVIALALAIALFVFMGRQETPAASARG